VLRVLAVELLAAAFAPLLAYVANHHGHSTFTRASFGATLLVTFFIAIWPTVILHELGHAVAVRLCGGRVVAVRIGTGPNREWQRGDVTYSVGLIPWHGATAYDAHDVVGRRRNLAVVLGGFAGQLVLVLLGLLALLHPSQAVAVVGTFVVMLQVLVMMLNAMPIVRTIKGRPVVTDGVLAWRMLRPPT